MFVVTVEFEIDPSHIQDFMPAMLENAEKSKTLEDGCIYFDVCQDQDASHLVFLYEIYKLESDFTLHLQSQHFQDFDKLVSPWVQKKSVKTWTKCD
ncbi:putative quinol monooxygenase [Agaribacter flavus]|uniref:Quinol monooxygenase n=1 Tax=Agaribacter flavus TaxID=1902781 RepID=A0ABV7FLN3_9ALTE